MSRTNEFNLKEFYTGIIKQTPFRFGHQFTVEFFSNDSEQTSYFTNVNGQPITYYIRSTKIPKADIKSATVPFLAAGFVVPGVIAYPEEWDVTILLDSQLTAYTNLKRWHDSISSYKWDGGGKKVIPSVTGKVNLLDNTMQNVVKRYMIEGIWIQELGNVDFQYQEGAGEVKTCPCKFTMQYFYEVDVETDPLAGR
jgi:hypothetical protein